MRRLSLALLAVALVATASAARQLPPQKPPAQVPSESVATTGLRFTFVDVEGGAATLIVTPAGESILIDSGNPGDRDAGRIAAAAKAAGVTEITHYITTHYHSDHFGGIFPLSKIVPVKNFYGHRPPDPLSKDISPELMKVWTNLANPPLYLEPGDSIKLRGARGTPTPRLRVLAANGRVEGEKADAPTTFTCTRGHEPMASDPNDDNGRSLVLHLSYGQFDLLTGGDLFWNGEHKLVCPRRLVPEVDVFLVNHHGLDVSNNPLLVEALAPEVAIVANGPRKGAEPRTMGLLIKQLRDVGVFQLHRNVRPGAANVEPARIANPEEACAGNPLQLRVEPDGHRFVVSIPARHTDRVFSSK
jgi:beta-lactamase superfamily II metal-dependent hydrolase